MKTLLRLILTISSALSFGQSVDSIAFHKVDSLLKISKEFTSKKEFEKALSIGIEAEQIALKKLGIETQLYGNCAFNLGSVNYVKGDYSESEKWYIKSQEIRKRVLGIQHLDYAKSLNSLGVLYYKKGNYEKTEPLYLEALGIREKNLGKEHPDYAMSLNNIAVLYKNMGQYDKSESFFLQTIEIRKKILGTNHADYANSLNSLANLYADLGQYEKAEPLYLEAMEIRKKILGSEHTDYANSLINLAGFYAEIGNYEKAEPIHLEAINIFKKVLGKENSNYAINLINLANMYRDMGQYEKAVPILLEAIEISKKTLGTEHPNYASNLESLATLYYVMGYYEKARSLYLETKEILKKVLGTEHPDYASILSSLAILDQTLGKYNSSEPLFLEAKEIRKKTLGIKHPKYARNLINLADMYEEMGNYEKAEPLYLEAKAIFQEVLGTQHPDYAACLNNLAGLYKTKGNYEKAELLFLEAQEIWGIVFGKEHPDYATNLMNLANFYSDIGNNEKAGPLYFEGKEIIKKSVGIEHHLYATSLDNLAVYYLDLGNYEKAEPLLLEAKEIIKKTLGVEHPDYSKNLNNLAVIYAKTQRLKESEILLNESTALDQSRLLHSAAFLSEKELSKYNALFSGNNSQIASMALVYTKDSILTKTTLSDLMYNQILFQKGFLLNAASKLNGLVTTTPELEEINVRLKEYRRRLAIEYTKPIAERNDVSDLEEKANTAEKELARKVKGYDETQRLVKWQEVQRFLKEDEAAIEFIYFDNNYNKPSDSVMYAALVLESGSKEPKFIPLFEEKQLTNRFLKSSETNVVSQLYASRGATPINEQSFVGLYDLIWKPLENILDGVKTIYYSPSGLLHRINFDGIPKDEKTILADKFKLVRLGSTRALVVSDQSKANSSNRAILFGGINYDLDTTLNTGDTNTMEFFASAGSEISFSYAERGLRNKTKNWGFLPGTGREIEALNSLFSKSNFKTTSLSGHKATEEVFKQIGIAGESPRVLHIATHGYFFPDPVQSHSNIDQNEPVFKMSDHPMIRSGLILANANYAWKEGKPFKEGMEDGILTAYEISQMNLSNTELVVLSACETGLGDIQGNEGVYGMQRAFKIAGAKYVIMSLWQVPDEETKEFMNSFYKNWLNKKLSIPDTFRKTQQEMRQKYENPYNWAGFVLVE